MNESPPKIGRYAVIGIVVLFLLIILAWFAFREEPPPPNQQSLKVETVKPVAPAFEPADDLSSETPTNQPDNSAVTNAADLYRQAFALYDALSQDEKGLLGDWGTNVGASVEAELCEKIRPICDIMHQASAVTNCDWGVDLDMGKMDWSHLQGARTIARIAIWSAAHCRTNDAAGSINDTLSTLRLGQQVSRTALLGCLTDIALQSLASSYVAQNLNSLSTGDRQRLVAAFSDPSYEQVPSRAMMQEATMEDRFAQELASLPPDDARKKIGAMGTSDGNITVTDQTDAPTILRQIADLDRELANAMSSSSEEQYEAWHQHATELQESNPLVESTLQLGDNFVDKMTQVEVNRAMVVTGLSVAQGGTSALPSHPDLSSGQPFVYTETPDGFELRSTYQANGKSMTMQFKSR